MSEVIWGNTMKGGTMRSLILKRHRSIRFTTQGDGANLALLAYNTANLCERYNMADTLKGQHTAFLTRGNCLYSDMGRVLLSFTDDQCGWHDTIGGLDNPKLLNERFGTKSYQEAKNNFYRNGRDNMLTELGKWGLGKKDVVPNVNLFSKVWIDEESGTMNYVSDQAAKKCSVTLRAEMDVLLVMSATHHPLFQGEYNPPSIALEMLSAVQPKADDFCRNHSEQNGRAFTNTENFVELGV